jgi:hypothetical protein
MLKLNQLFRFRGLSLQRLHVFTDGTDSVVGFDLTDAVDAWTENIGEDREDYYDEFYPVRDGESIRINIDAYDSLANQNRPLCSKIDMGRVPFISAPAWAWALQNGRGFLCSTEW